MAERDAAHPKPLSDAPSLVLPVELWPEILSQLSLKELYNVASVSVQWSRLISTSIRSLDRRTEVRNASKRLFGKELVNLTSLNLIYSTSASLAGDHFRAMTQLTCLNLRGNRWIDGGCLSCLVNLKELGLMRTTGVHDGNLMALTTLTSLELGNNLCITDAGLKPLVMLQKLSLYCNDKITDDGLSHLTNLTSLELSGCRGITDYGIWDLNLTDLDLRNNISISDAALMRMTSLTVLDVCANEVISDEAISRLTLLKVLDTFQSPKITANSLSRLVNLVELTTMNVEEYYTMEKRAEYANYVALMKSLFPTVKFRFSES